MSRSDEKEDKVIRWLEDSISAQELESLKSDSDFDTYDKIISEVDAWELPDLDVAVSYDSLKQKLPHAKVVKWYQSTSLKIAASFTLIALLVSYIILWDTDQEFRTGIAETKEFILPDSSKVVLRPQSSIKFDEDTWTTERSIELQGRAFFDVNKGVPFTVSFDKGLVKVIGTSFEVTSMTNLKEVVCYSGRVRAMLSGFAQELTKGQGLVAINETAPKSINTTNNWAKNKVYFRQAPLSVVLRSLELHFDITIKPQEVNTNRTFTGAFVIDNVDEALDMVLETMDIDYEKINETVTLR
ncbi:MAG: FecR domain-containing protein [Bacteroidota bacterium]